MTAPARFDVHAKLDTAASSSTDTLQMRVFRFPAFGTVAYDGSPGWNYSDAILNLIRAVEPGFGRPVNENFELRFTVSSVGRFTVGYWIINALLMSKGVPLRQITLGNHQVAREPGPRNLQGSISAALQQGPYNTGMYDLTEAEFLAIDEVYLFSSGQQESL
jgi:hypothetical protein